MSKPKSQWELDCLRRQEQINGYARRCFQPRVREVNKILIYHPDEFRRYLKQHPCTGCGAKPCCKTPCAAYTQWEQAKRGGR